MATEKVFQEKKIVALILNSCEKANEESFEQVSLAYAWQRETNDWSSKQDFFQNIGERPFNMTSILNKFKSLIKKVYKKGCTPKLNKKKDKNNYFRAEIS